MSMTTSRPPVPLPDPALPTAPPDLVAALSAAVGPAQVRSDELNLAQYATDASNYRVIPRAVVVPRHRDDVEAILAVSRETGTPVTARGGGTSVAGNSIGPGIVIDFSRHLNRIEIDPEARTATVEP